MNEQEIREKENIGGASSSSKKKYIAEIILEEKELGKFKKRKKEELRVKKKAEMNAMMALGEVCGVNEGAREEMSKRMMSKIFY